MLVKKWVPCPLWDVTGLQDWLNEEAAAGYALSEWPRWNFIGWVRFREDATAPRSRYCLDPIGERLGEAELRSRTGSYGEYGWRYVGKVGQLYAIYRCDDPEAPALYSDPESLSLAMKKQMRWMWLGLLFWLIWPVALFWDEWPLLFHYPAEFARELILRAEVLIPIYGVMLALAILAVSWGIGTFLGVRRVRRFLRRGAWPPAGPRRYPERRYFRIGCIITLVFVLYLGAMLISGGERKENLSGPEDWDFPHVTLVETLPEGAELLWEYSDAKLIHRDTRERSLLAPEQYDVAQGAMVKAPDGKAKEARFYLEFVRAVSPSLARTVYQGRVEAQWHTLNDYQESWVENSLFNDNDQGAYVFHRKEELSWPGLDALTRFTWQYAGETDVDTVYVGLAGERVFAFHCIGVSDPDIALELFVSRLDDEN